MNIVNLTPHEINLNNGTNYPASGEIARAKTVWGDPGADGIGSVTVGEITGLPDPKDGTVYIVSGIVSSIMKDRTDIVSPATGHSDCIRNEKGQIVSVPFLTRSV